MAFWWVNHKQTYKQETDGGYIWSPKANKNGAYNQSYENLTLCNPGDIIFSYAFQEIRQVGIIRETASTQAKPPEFGEVGDNWSQEGWLVNIDWSLLQKPLVPSEFGDQLLPLMPEKYSPLSRKTGRGLQGIYLASLSQSLGELLLTLIQQIGNPNLPLQLVLLEEDAVATDALVEDLESIQQNPNSTEREALTKARLGQGLFRQRVAQLEPVCRVTGLARPEFLIASHIKPWRDCSNEERLNGHNGLLLSPHVDKLFDRHWISFDHQGQLLCRHPTAAEALACWGIREVAVLKPLSPQQEKFMAAHRAKLKS